VKRWPAPRTILLGLALADLVVFGAWITREEVARRAGAEVLLPVEGYDPRDLLSGHYVRFRLVAAREAAQLAPPPDMRARGEVAYCLERQADGRAHVVRPRVEGDSCPLFVTATVGPGGGLDFGVDRFYVDERRQGEAVGLAAGDTHLVARIDGGGHIHPVDLVVRGKSLRGRRP
jgi:uncharacterized membrane-anchored protein